MCDIRPGPRCPYDMKKKIESRQKKLEKEILSHGENSSQAILAQERLELAKIQYDATQEGIDKLAQEISTSNKYDEQLIERYKKAKITNEIQHFSVSEVKNSRADLIAKTYANFFGYNKEEIYSIIETLREEQETQTLETMKTENLEPVSQETWNRYLSNLEDNTRNRANTQSNLADIESIKNITSLPPKYILKAYMNLPKTVHTAQEHEKNSHKNIALLLGTTPEIVSAKYVELKEEYGKKYLGTDRNDTKPNPPEHWVKGETVMTGFMNNPKTRYAPHDPASMYATYKMMYDPNVIPDYQKQAKTYATVTETPTHLIVKTYTTTGKPIKRQSLPKNENSIGSLEKTLQGSTLITEKHSSIKAPHISLESMALQHLDLPSYSKQNVAAALKETNLDTVQLFAKTLTHSRRLWNNKLARRNA